MNSNMLNLWYNIDEHVSSESITYNNLSQIEKAIIDDDYNLVDVLIKKGETIYKNDILCNGLYQTRFNVHPQKCHPFLCFKTLPFYGLWKSYYYYSYIFSLIIDFLDDNHCDFGNVNTNVKEIYDLMISVNCCNEINKHKNFYDDTFVNFGLIDKVLQKNVQKIIEYMEKNYSVDEFIPTEEANVRTLKCYKNKLGKFYVFNRESKDRKEPHDTIASMLIGELKYVWNQYKQNNKIVRLLFSQQALEYYKYMINNKTYQLEQIFNSIVSNPYVDINHTQNEQNIFSLTMTQQNKHDMITKIKQHGGELPESTTIIDIVEKCYSGMTKEIIKNASVEFLGNLENLLKIILNCDKMMSTDKIEIFEILMNRCLLDDIDNLIELCLYDNKSLGLLEKMTERKLLISKALTSDIILCIKLLKHKELDILFSNNLKLIEEKYEGYSPIIHYFENTETDGVEEILTLKIFLKYQCNLEVTNKLGDTPLLYSIKKSRENSCILLLKSKANPLFYDIKGHNSLHNAILTNNIQIIDLLIKHDNNLINITTKNFGNDKTIPGIHPIVFSINSASPVLITQMILAENKMDYNYLYEGNGILHYLIKFDMDVKTKNTLFKNLIAKDFNLLEQCRIDMKPLVVKAVEKNLYEIVVMIMNKLLEKEEIRFEGYDNLKDIGKIIGDNTQRNIIVKDTTSPNFYSLVMFYLKTSKPTENKSNNIMKPNQKKTNDTSFHKNMFMSFVCTFIQLFNDKTKLEEHEEFDELDD